MIFLITAAQEHCEGDFDMIFHFKAAQNVVALHYERDFDMISCFKTAQNLVTEHYERYFDIIFHFKGSSILGCRALCKRFLLDFPI